MADAMPMAEGAPAKRVKTRAPAKAAAAKSPTDDAPYRERRIGAQDGLKLYFRDYGDPASDKLPVLCLTGVTRNSRDYHDFASRIAHDRRVLALDYRGRGLSARDPDWHNYAAQVYADDIRQVMAATNCHRVIAVGTSLGAILTMGLAVLAPMAIAAAILNDAGPELDTSGLARIVAYIGEDRPVDGWDAAAARAKELFPAVGQRSETEWKKIAYGTFREGADGLLHYDWDPAIAKALAAAGPVPDLWPYYRALRPVPVLALRGEISDVLAADTFERMGHDMPNLTRVTVKGVGHVPSLAEPEARQAIDAFLSTL
jgi:pimeloyl-ACP methyl ester carboxylesterase